MTAAHTAPTVEPAEAILAALARLGQATAADTATAAGVAYSTATRNLRELAATGRVQKVQDGKQAQWRLPTATATADDRTGAGAPTADLPEQTAPQDESRDNAQPDGEPAATAGAVATAEPGAATPELDAVTAEPDATTADDQAGTAAGSSGNQAAPSPALEDTGGDTTAAPATVQVAPEPADDPARTERSTVEANTAQPDVPDVPDAPATPGTDSGPAPAASRRASGTLDGAVLDILEAEPQRGFKVSELCKRIDAANQGQDVSKASPGAVVLAAQRLVGKGRAVLAVEKPATFRLVATDPATADR
jgi:hypothetical protein